MKRLLQKFLLFYPFYAEGHEMMGDVYAREENVELALNFYEKALLIAQSKVLGDKIKKARDILDKGKNKPEAQKNDAFFDITETVIQNEERIIGRGKELRQMIEILISNSKRNLLLIGERGVGKSALIRLLAQKIIFGEVPPALKEKKIKEINFVSLLTGSKYRGQFEEKVLKLLQEFKAQNAILVLEDMHLMMSTGAARGTSLDLVNILKNFLRDNSIQVIATTDYEEYKNTIEKDNSLLGYFQKIIVNELSPEGTRKILKNLVGQLVDCRQPDGLQPDHRRHRRERQARYPRTQTARFGHHAPGALHRQGQVEEHRRRRAVEDRGGRRAGSAGRYRQPARNQHLHLAEEPPGSPAGQYPEAHRRPGRSGGQDGLVGHHVQAGLRRQKEPARRRLHVHRPDRRGQDRDRHRPERSPLRQPGLPDPHRHVGIHGKVHLFALCRRGARLCRAITTPTS